MVTTVTPCLRNIRSSQPNHCRWTASRDSRGTTTTSTKRARTARIMANNPGRLLLCRLQGIQFLFRQPVTIS